MPQKYEKTAKPYNEETIKIAVKEVSEGASVRCTALKYHMFTSMRWQRCIKDTLEDGETEIDKRVR